MYEKLLSVEFDTLEAPLRILRWHKLWPKQGGTLRTKWAMFKATLVFTFFSFSLCATLLHIRFAIQHPQTIIINDIIEGMITVLVNLTVFYTIYSMMIHEYEIKEFIKYCRDFRKFGKPAKFDEVNTIFNWFSYFFYIYGCSGVVIYATMGLLDWDECLKRDIHHTRICGFLLPIRLPFPIKTSVTFAAVWLTQCFSLMVFINSGITVMAFILASVEIFITKIVHMRKLILKLGDQPETAKNALKVCVQYHVDIIRMTKNLNICWGSLMLYHQFLVTGILSMIGIQCLLEPNLKYLIHGGGWFVSLAIPCYAGQRLLDESSKIPWAMYSSLWYNVDKSVQKDLIYMIMCANNYLDLNRDGYGPMNLSIVGQVVNNIYSLLTLLYGSMLENLNMDK